MIKPKLLSKLLISFIGLLFLIILISLHNVAYAQVNINSKSSAGDNNYYELLEADTVLEETIINQTEENIIQEMVAGLENDIISSSFTPQFVKNIVNTIGLPTATAALASVAFLPTLISLIPLIFLPNFFSLLIAAIFGEKKNIWGIVYDHENKKPIAFAVVRLYESGSTGIKDQKVSDLQGRYGFVLSIGSYRVEVSHSDYGKFIKDIEISKKEEIFAEDIPMRKEQQLNLFSLSKKIFVKFKNFTLKYSIFFAVIGFFASIVALFVTNNFINTTVFFAYLMILVLYVYVKTRDNRNWGIVKDSVSGLAINGATVRLFDKRNNLSDSKITDNKGRFGFLVDPGEYSLLVDAYGYNFPSKTQEELTLNKDNPNLLDLHVKKTNWLNLVIRLDATELPEQTNPATLNRVSDAAAQLLSPFS